MEYYCVVCGKMLKGQKRKYCNNSCKCKHFYNTHKDYCIKRFKKYRKPRVNNKCLNCGKECGRKKYCSDKCKPIKISLLPHQKILNSINTKCSICNATFIVCHIHHINGKHNDNRKENLINLCPKCHSAVHNNKDYYTYGQSQKQTKIQNKVKHYRNFLNK